MDIFGADASERARFEVFSACPASLGDDGRAYFNVVASVARWSEIHGCRGILVYSDNRLADPWLVSQIIVQQTRALSPLIAAQPVYMHPYALAKQVATFAYLHRRQLHLNWVAGGFKNDLESLADPTPHDRRYDRLVEYASLVRKLTAGETVTFHGEFYRVKGLALSPRVVSQLGPAYMVSGSSEAGRAAALALGARSITCALPRGEDPGTCSGSGLEAGMRVGILARETREEAWRLALERFPPDRAGALTRAVARRVSDSEWHARLCQLAEEHAAVADPYWLVPFENYKTMCPYLVGDHEEVAGEVARYVSEGFRTFIMDEPACEDDLAHAAAVFRLAGRLSEVASR
jgi:alkanesulfonate monooxygenase